MKWTNNVKLMQGKKIITKPAAMRTTRWYYKMYSTIIFLINLSLSDDDDPQILHSSILVVATECLLEPLYLFTWYAHSAIHTPRLINRKWSKCVVRPIEKWNY